MPCIILAAFILDCIIGDPQNPLHPMRIIGKGISLCITAYRKAKVKNRVVQFITGAFVSLLIIGLSFTVTFLITHILYRFNFWVGLSIEAVICYFLIAAKALKNESMRVHRDLAADDIEAARKSLSFIVGRETQNLDKPAIVKGAVETVAENVSDGVIAPLLFILIGGAPLGMAYKAVNTLDSMTGYRNEEFEYFGKFAARLDDVVNFIPARVSAWLMIIGSVFTGMDVKSAVRIYFRDRYNHKSPNSAQTESVCAGALGLRLGGDNYYHGELVHKPTMGDDLNEPVPEHIVAANRLMYAASVCAVVLFSALGVIIFLLRSGCHV